MAYFKINDNDYSLYINALKVNNSTKYNAQTNAAGDTVVDYINSKRTIEVGIIPLDDEALKNLLLDIDKFSVTISFRNPKTNELEEGINCIIPDNKIEYYTIQADNVSYNGFNIKIIEL